MNKDKKEINLQKMRTIFENNPNKKREVQQALGFDRQTMSKVLNRVRNITGSELLTIAEICDVDPMELAQ